MFPQDMHKYGPHAPEAEVIYFRLYRSYLLQTTDLKTNYEMLLDLWKNHPEVFNIFSKCDLERLRRVQKDLQNNQHTLFSGPMDLGPEIPETLKKEKTSTRHQDICREITRSPNVLAPHVGGSVEFINREHPTYFGPIDILVQNQSCAYIIEVKTSSADHSICGQVQKYFIGLSLRLHLKAFDEIKIITLCPGYDKASYQGLRQIGAKMLVLKDDPIQIKALSMS